jgi:hypothetical protein
MCWLPYIAGLDTVHAGLGHTFRYLGEHTDKRDELVKDPTLIPAAVEELLRWHSWVNPPRTVATHFEFHGMKLKKGDCVVALAAIADRGALGHGSPGSGDRTPGSLAPARNCASSQRSGGVGPGFGHAQRLLISGGRARATCGLVGSPTAEQPAGGGAVQVVIRNPAARGTDQTKSISWGNRVVGLP